MIFENNTTITAQDIAYQYKVYPNFVRQQLKHAGVNPEDIRWRGASQRSKRQNSKAPQRTMTPEQRICPICEILTDRRNIICEYCKQDQHWNHNNALPPIYKALLDEGVYRLDDPNYLPWHPKDHTTPTKAMRSRRIKS